MFTWGCDDLNSEQKAAVLHPGSVFLVACPGSGKTKTLTYKIAYELSRLQFKKQYVIAITYTNRAADEIRERIEALGVDASRLWVWSGYLNRMAYIMKLLNTDFESLINTSARSSCVGFANVIKIRMLKFGTVTSTSPRINAF